MLARPMRTRFGSARGRERGDVAERVAAHVAVVGGVGRVSPMPTLSSTIQMTRSKCGVAAMAVV